MRPIIHSWSRTSTQKRRAERLVSDATSDMTSIIVGLYGVDAVTPSDKLEYCFDYNMQYPEFSIWINGKSERSQGRQGRYGRLPR